MCLVRNTLFAVAACLASMPLAAQHDHPAPEKLGSVQFVTSCDAAVQPQFTRAVALLHSFAYTASEKEFRQVVARDPKCAMAHWGVAMTYFHQLWEPPLAAADFDKGKSEIEKATAAGKSSQRETAFINASAHLYSSGEQSSLHDRMLAYENAISEVARANPKDTESQVFYALALLSTASPTDKTHANQKKAVAILEPLYAANPQHPGIAHYLIHSCDNAEMASLGVQAARDYSKIAPSAPHALHMPSHIFTRLGMWNDSVTSNQAAREAARQQSDVGEELHAMDYLTYAFLQLGKEDEASGVIADLQRLKQLPAQQFKVGYAATAMPVRYAVERQQWQEAAATPIIDNAPPQVSAIAIWARAVGFARGGHPEQAERGIEKLKDAERHLRETNNKYWADQVTIQIAEANAWTKMAQSDGDAAKQFMTSAADLEDSIEKLPLTPGPIVPAREQLGDLLLELKDPGGALEAYEMSMQQSPGRRNALLGALKAAQLSHNQEKAKKYAATLLDMSNK